MSKHMSKQWFPAMLYATIGLATLIPSAASSADNEATRILEAMSSQFITVANEIKPSVVNISISRKARATVFRHPLMDDPLFRRFFGDPLPEQQPPQERRRPPQAVGSGVIVSSDGYILTNNHVVEDAERVVVRLSDTREFEATVVGSDPPSDVAVIKIEGNGFPAARLGDSDKLRSGEWVLAVGSPLQLQQTVTFGIVSAVGRSNVGVTDYENFIQTDASINPGNSGGPLLDLYGNVVGINSAIATFSGGYMGIGFAIPINMAKRIMDQLISEGKVTRGYLGVGLQELNAELSAQFGLPDARGALVTNVFKDSPAEKAGVQSGDVILTWNNEPVRDPAHLRNMVAETAPGTEIRMTVKRDGEEKSFRIRVGNREDMPGVASSEGAAPGGSGAKSQFARLGVTVKDLDPALAEQYGYAKDTKAVIVTEVELGGPAAQAGIVSGCLILSVGRTEVKTVKELETQLKAVADGQKVLLRIQNKDIYSWVSVELKAK